MVNDAFQLLKQNMTFQDLFNALGIPYKNSGNISCPLPGHSDKTPSFSINERDSFFKCFGCGASGDHVDFLQAYQNMDTVEAYNYCADIVGIPSLLGTQEKRCPEAGVIDALLEGLTSYAYDLLRSDKYYEYYELLQSHYGFEPDTIDHFRVGYLPTDAEIKAYIKNTFDLGPEWLVKIGMSVVSANTKGKGAYNSFAGRLLFPYLVYGKVVYLAGRLIPSLGKEQRKYVKLKVGRPDNQVSSYIKNRTIYNEDALRDTSKGYFLFTEGFTDVMSGWQNGLNVGSYATTRFPNGKGIELSKQLKRFDEVYNCNDAEDPKDGDKFSPGEKGARASHSELITVGIVPKQVILPKPRSDKKLDLNLYFQKHTREEFDVLMAEAKPLHIMMIGDEMTGITSSTELLSRIKKIASFIPRALQADLKIASQEIHIVLGRGSGISKAMIQGFLFDVIREISPKGDKTQKSGKESIRLFGIGNMEVLRDPYGYTKKTIDENGACGFDMITNFLMNSTEMRANVIDLDADGKYIKTDKTLYVYDVITKGGHECQELIIESENMTGVKKFISTCLNSGIRLTHKLTDLMVQNILSEESNRQENTVYYIDRIGRLKNCYFGGNFIKMNDEIIYAGKDGVYQLEDDRRVVVGNVWNNEETNLGKPTFATEVPPGTVERIITGFYNAYSYNGLVALAWTLGCHYRDLFIDAVGLYPLAHISGKYQVGKTFLAMFLQKVAGNAPMVSIKSSAPGVIRRMFKYSNMPIILDEYRVSDSKGKEAIFRSSYNGVPIDKARKDDQHGIISYNPNGSILIAGEDVPNDQALFSRLIDINLQECPPDIPVSNREIAPYRDVMSHLYYRVIEKALPSTGALKAAHNLCREEILEHLDSSGIGKVSDRDIDNWAVILHMLHTEILPHIKGVSIKKMMAHIGGKLCEKSNIQDEKDPVNVVFEFARKLVGDERNPIEQYVQTEYNPTYDYDGYIYIRDRILVETYIENVPRETRTDLTVSAILGYIRALQRDILRQKDSKDPKKGDGFPRAYFTINGKKQRCRCVRFKYNCQNNALRELRCAITGEWDDD